MVPGGGSLAGPKSDGSPRPAQMPRAGLLIVWLSGGILVILAVLLTWGYGLALGHSWLRLGFMLALAAMLLSASLMARRIELPGFGLVIYLVSLGLLFDLLPLLVGGLTQTGGPAAPSSGLGALLGSVIVFGAASLYVAGWDAPPLSGALILAGGMVALHAAQALSGPPWVILWTPIAFGALVAILASLRSLRQSEADHAFWAALTGLGILSVTLRSALPWHSAAGWLYLTALVLFGLLFMRVGRRFLGVLAMFAAALSAAFRAFTVNPFLGVIVGLGLMVLAMFLGVFAFRESAEREQETRHGYLWTQ